MTNSQQVTLQQHPLSAAFPAMPDEDVQALAEDIAKHGQREPGVLFEGKVLDGWHRYRACYSVGVEFAAATFDGEDPVAFVLSRNLHRRHLTAMQKASAVVAATNWRKRGSATVADPSAEELAEKADVSPRTIAHAKAAHEMGLGKEAREGRVTARQVERVAKMPKAKREKAVKDIKDGGAPPAPRKRSATVADPAQLVALQEKLAETQDALSEMTDLAKSAKAFEDKAEFKEMQVLRAELKSCKRRRDELMAENASLKKHVAHLQKKLGKK